MTLLTTWQCMNAIGPMTPSAGESFFSDQTVENLELNDPVSAKAISDEFIHWDLIDCFVNGEVERSDGHGFIGMGRKRLLQLLHRRASELGVELHFETEVELSDLNDKFADADVIVAADGLNSKVRNNNLDVFDCKVDVRPNKFVWLGTRQTFRDAFTFIFEKTEHGWVWAHAYQFDEETSTFIVECNADVHDAFGFDRMSHEESAEACRQIFADSLGGHELLTNSAHIRGSALDQLSFCAVPQLGNERSYRIDRRCGTHRTLRNWLGHQTGLGGCYFPGTASE